MSVILTVSINAGAPQSGDPVTGTEILAVAADEIQLSAVSKVGWSGSPPARWEMYDYPLGFACPAGWTDDATSHIYYYSGNENPPAVIADANWGKFVFNLSATEGTVRTTDYNTGVMVLGPNGEKSIGRGEGARFGGAQQRWVKNLKQDLKAAATILQTDPFAVGGPSPKGTIVLDPANDGTNQTITTKDSVGAFGPMDLIGSAIRVIGVASTFIRGITTGTPQGGLLVTPGADNAAVALAGRNADGTTAKPIAIELGADGAGGADLTEWLHLSSGGTAFCSIRRWTPGATPEIQIVGNDGAGGAQVDAFVITGRAINLQPEGLVEFNPGSSLYFSHAQGSKIYMRELVAGVPNYVADLSLDVDGPTVLKLRDGPTSFSITADQDTVGAGMPFTLRAAQGKAAFAGGALTIGAGDGGTPGTNAPGPLNINTGTPVANVGGQFNLTNEDGTPWLRLYQSGAGQSLISGGPAGAETHFVTVRGTYTLIESSTGFCSFVAAADTYIDHGTGVHNWRESGVAVATEKFDANGTCYRDFVSGVTGVEWRHNTAVRIAFNGDDITLETGASDAVVRKSNTVEYHREICRTEQSIGAVNADIVTYSLPDNQTTMLVGNVVVSNDTDNEGGGFSELRVFYRRVAAGAPVLIGAAVGGVGQLDASIGAATLAVAISGNSAILRGAGVAAKTIQWAGTLRAHRVTIS